MAASSKDPRRRERSSHITAADPHAPLTPPRGHPRFPLVDGVRALAALSVLLFHVGSNDGANLAGGLGAIGAQLSIGVPIFFAISGFVLYRPFANARLTGARRPVVREYLRRRVLRIVPAYWVALILLALFAGWSEVFSHEFWRYFGFLQIYDNRTFDQGLSVAWTLCIEVSFYLLLPLYAAAIDRASRAVDGRRAVRRETAILLALGLVSFAFLETVGARHGFVRFPSETIAGNGFWFVPGMLLAIWTVPLADPSAKVRMPRSERVAVVFWTLAVVLLVIKAYATRLGVPRIASDALTPLLAFCVLAPATVERPATTLRLTTLPHWILGSRLMAWLGLISYPIYLYHGTLVSWLDAHGAARIVPFSPWVGLAVASVLASVCAGACSWYLVERPILRHGAHPRTWLQAVRPAARRAAKAPG